MNTTDMTLEPYLEFGSLDGKPQRWAIGDAVLIGRDPSQPEGAVTLRSSEVSRDHAKVERTTSGYWVTDLESRNGTFVNGERVASDGARLHDGDQVVFAGSVVLTFRDPLSTPIAPRIGRLTGLWIDPETDAVWIDAQRVEPPLSARQLGLLQCLYDNEAEVVSRIQIVDEVWAGEAPEGVSDEAVTALIKRLRGRLADFESNRPLIEIIRGRGVRLTNPG